MDGINGMAGITGACALALMAWYIYSLEGPSPFFIMTGCVALACIGFLPFNMPSARVFMGDIGSIFLGGLFGGLVYSHSHVGGLEHSVLPKLGLDPGPAPIGHLFFRLRRS